MLPLFSLLALLAAAPSRAAFELDGLEASLLFADHRKLGANPATLGSLPCFTWQLAHHLPFGLRELRYDQIVLGLPFKQAGASLSFSSTGFDLHRELGWRLALGFSRHSLGLGVGLNFLSLAQRGVPSRRSFAPTAGLLFKPSPKLQLATWWQKATPISSGRFFVSITRHLDARSSLYLHGRRYPTRPARFDLAAVHRLHPRLKLRLGLRSVPRRFALGAGFSMERLQLDYGVVTHAYLGPSHTFHLANTCRSP